ncbi:hypothetical protein E2C01_008532 [Portunus trituberculatus]|uniref:Uncharacterized protein n=1 Tax=Portunus trituberculatus TaxID=210409 RepID=A0A5B7D3E0_PORTR|nr:hypothetical protein [Portunus trituberculatus]
MNPIKRFRSPYLNYSTICLEGSGIESHPHAKSEVWEPGTPLTLNIKGTKERRSFRLWWQDPKIIIVRDAESRRTRDTARGRLRGDLDNGGG